MQIPPAQSTRPPIRPDMTVRQVVADYPACREVLRRHGEPEDRPTKFGDLEPLDHFARRHGIDLDQLLTELAQAAGTDVDRDSANAQLIHRPFAAGRIPLAGGPSLRLEPYLCWPSPFHPPGTHLGNTGRERGEAPRGNRCPH
jgi:hypothetical protein